jgi:hypothetical protein
VTSILAEQRSVRSKQQHYHRHHHTAMAPLNTNASLISTVLSPLENLKTDEYIIAFGAHGKQFIGTPNGYSAYVVLA